MRSGLLRHRIKIETPPGTLDAARQIPTTGWSVFTENYPAYIRPLNGRELQAAREQHAEVSHEVMIRYLSGVNPEMRIVYGSRTLEIQSVLNVDERGREMRLLCTEKVA